MERVRAALRSATGGGAGVDRDGDRDGLGGGGAGLAGGLNSSHSSGAGAGAYPPLAPPPAPPPLFAAGRAAAAAYTRAAPRPSLLAGGAGGRSSFATGVERFGVQSKGLAYFRDPFHSMVSLPTGRFYAMFFAVYLALYVLFALLYLSFSDRCIKGLEGRFSHALWIASRTAGECEVFYRFLSVFIGCLLLCGLLSGRRGWFRTGFCLRGCFCEGRDRLAEGKTTRD